MFESHYPRPVIALKCNPPQLRNSPAMTVSHNIHSRLKCFSNITSAHMVLKERIVHILVGQNEVFPTRSPSKMGAPKVVFQLHAVAYDNVVVRPKDNLYGANCRVGRHLTT